MSGAAVSEIETHAAVEFLKAFDPDGWHNIVAIGLNKIVTAQTFAPGQFSQMYDFIDEHNGRANLYFSVNEPRPNAPHDKLSAADIAAARAVHVDLDPPAGADLAADRIESVRKISSGARQPTFLLDSGGGIQAFWKFDKKLPIGDGEWLRGLNEAACAAFDGDPAVKNVDRIMRLPHTLNIPTKPKLKKHPGRQARMAVVIDASGPLHEQAVLASTFPPVQIHRPDHAVMVTKTAALETIRSAIATIPNADLPYHEWIRVMYALWVAVGEHKAEGYAIFDDWSAKSEAKYDPDETLRAWSATHDVKRIGAGTLFHLATANGWKRPPILASGEFEPVGIDDEATAEPESHSEGDPVDLWSPSGAPVLPERLLPDMLERYARVQARSMGVDPGGIAAAALAVCAAAISDDIKLRVKEHDDHWHECARIWVALVGEPSARKSPILTQVVAPLRRMDAELARSFQEAKAKYDKLNKEEQKSHPEPVHRRMMLEDTTIEAAQEILKGSPAGVLCFQDELSGWFGSMDKYSGAKGAAKDRSFYLTSYNGGPYATSRITRGSAYIENLSISMLGGIQPDAIRKVTDGGVDDGLLQRILPIVLHGAKQGVDEPAPPVVDEYRRLITALTHLKPARHVDADGLAGVDPVHLRFDPEAQALRRELEQKHLRFQSIEAVNKKLASHIGKLDGMFARLCVIWHCVEHCEGGLPELVTLETARRVARFMEEFLLPHALAFYGGVLGADHQEELSYLAGYILAHPEIEHYAFRDVNRGGRQMRALTKDEAHKLLERLEYYGWLRSVPPKTFGAAPRWKVNGRVHQLFHERGRQEKQRRDQAKSVIAELKAA